MHYKLIRSKNRWRSASLKVTREGEVVVYAPVLMPRFMIDQFVEKHRKWIEKRQNLHNNQERLSTKYFSDPNNLIRFIQKKINTYSKSLKLYPKAIRYKSVKTYWGSCTPSGVISFNLKLQYVPAEAVEYVVVHELCHLKWRGHGQRFWDLVKKTYPKTNEMRQILRQISREP